MDMHARNELHFVSASNTAKKRIPPLPNQQIYTIIAHVPRMGDVGWGRV